MPHGSHGWVSAHLAQSKGQAGVYPTFEKGDLGTSCTTAFGWQSKISTRRSVVVARNGSVMVKVDTAFWLKKAFRGVTLSDHADKLMTRSFVVRSFMSGSPG